MTTKLKNKEPQPAKIKIAFGALSPALVQQLKKQGYRFQLAEEGRHLQKDYDAILRLRIRLSLPDTTMDQLATKFLKKITQKIKPI